MLRTLFATAATALFSVAWAHAAPLSGAERATLSETKLLNGSSVPTDAAINLAAKIGADGNVEGVRAIIALQRPWLAERAIDTLSGSWDQATTRTLPEPVEALVVEFYADRYAHQRLLVLVGRNQSGDGGGLPKYRSRALFALLLSDLKQKRNDGHLTYLYATRIICTDLEGIEQELVAALPAVRDLVAADQIVRFLANRRYAPAVPVLTALQTSIPLARNVNGFPGNVNLALLKIGTPEAIQAVLARLAWLGKQSDERAMYEIAGVLQYLARTPAETRLDYAALRPLLPKELSTDATRQMLAFIAARKDKNGMPDLLVAAARANDEALTLVLSWGTTNDWRATQAAIEQAISAGTLNAEQTMNVRRRLAEALADPARQVAANADVEGRQSFVEAKAAIDQQRAAANNLRLSDPKRYVAEMEDALQRAEKLIAANPGRQEATWYRRDVSNEAKRLAGYVRFTFADPARAVTLYERSIALATGLPPPENSGLEPRVALAETVRFDLKDGRRSLAIYEELLQRQSVQRPSTNTEEAVIQRALVAWLRAEIAYLRDGKRYAGAPDRDELGPIAMLVMYGADNGLIRDDPQLSAMMQILHSRAVSPEERRDFARRLEGLSPSQARLIGAVDLLPLLGSSDRIASLLRKNDPAGYLTASIFAVWHALEDRNATDKVPQALPGVRMATWTDSDRALMRQAEIAALGREVVLSFAPDPRLASPESTWKTFLDAVGRSDFDAAWKCTTPGIRNKFESRFTAMTPSQRKVMIDTFVSIERSVQFGEFVEATVVLKSGRASSVTFVRQGKEWRITEM